MCGWEGARWYSFLLPAQIDTTTYTLQSNFLTAPSRCVIYGASISDRCSQTSPHQKHYSTTLWLGREVAALKTLKDIDHNLKEGGRIVDLINFEIEPKDPEGCLWFATHAIYPSVSLKQLLKGFQSGVPKEFLAHIFLQLCDVLRFLHHEHQPQITHGDFQPENVLVNIGSRHSSSFPSLVVHDFSGSRKVTWDQEASRKSDEYGLAYIDVGRLRDMIESHMNEETTKTCSEQWLLFVEEVRAGIYSDLSFWKRTAAEVWEKHESAVREVRDSRHDSVGGEVGNTTLKVLVASGKECVGDELLLAALGRVA